MDDLGVPPFLEKKHIILPVLSADFYIPSTGSDLFYPKRLASSTCFLNLNPKTAKTAQLRSSMSRKDLPSGAGLTKPKEAGWWFFTNPFD